MPPYGDAIVALELKRHNPCPLQQLKQRVERRRDIVRSQRKEVLPIPVEGSSVVLREAERAAAQGRRQIDDPSPFRYEALELTLEWTL